MLSEVQKIHHQFKPSEMQFYGSFQSHYWIYCFKKGKLSNPKKIQAILNMFIPQNSQHIQVFNDMAQFYRCFIKNFVTIMAPITKFTRNYLSYGQKNVRNLGAYKE